MPNSKCEWYGFCAVYVFVLNVWKTNCPMGTLKFYSTLPKMNKKIIIMKSNLLNFLTKMLLFFFLFFPISSTTKTDFLTPTSRNHCQPVISWHQQHLCVSTPSQKNPVRVESVLCRPPWLVYKNTTLSADLGGTGSYAMKIFGLTLMLSGCSAWTLCALGTFLVILLAEVSDSSGTRLRSRWTWPEYVEDTTCEMKWAQFEDRNSSAAAIYNVSWWADVTCNCC